MDITAPVIIVIALAIVFYLFRRDQKRAADQRMRNERAKQKAKEASDEVGRMSDADVDRRLRERAGRD